MNNWRKKVQLAIGFLIVGSMLALTWRNAAQRPVRIECLHRGLDVYDAKYFSTGHFDVIFAPLVEQFKLRYRLLLAKFGAPFVPVNGYSLHGSGPALVIHGRVKDGLSARLDLLSGNGELVAPWGQMPVPFFPANTTNTFIWCLDLSDSSSLTNGCYRLARRGTTNVLANIFVGI